MATRKRLARLRKLRLRPCPFCGILPEFESWHGGKPTKVLVFCDNDDCPVSPQVSGEAPLKAADYWNERPEGYAYHATVTETRK